MPNHEPKGAEWMREIAALGGKASAQRRYDSQDAAARCLSAHWAARARWKKSKWSGAEEAAYLEGWKAGMEHGTGWRTRRKRSRPDEDVKSGASRDDEMPATEPGFPIDRQGLKAALSDVDSPRFQKFLPAL